MHLLVASIQIYTAACLPNIFQRLFFANSNRTNAVLAQCTCTFIVLCKTQSRTMYQLHSPFGISADSKRTKHHCGLRLIAPHFYPGLWCARQHVFLQIRCNPSLMCSVNVNINIPHRLIVKIRYFTIQTGQVPI